MVMMMHSRTTPEMRRMNIQSDCSVRTAGCGRIFWNMLLGPFDFKCSFNVCIKEMYV